MRSGRSPSKRSGPGSPWAWAIEPLGGLAARTAPRAHVRAPGAHGPGRSPGPGRGCAGAQLWVGLARRPLATAPEDTRPAPTEPAVIAQAIDEHSKTEATGYDQVIVGYLLQIAAELKTAGSAEAAAAAAADVAAHSDPQPETLQRLVEMGATLRSGASSSPMRPMAWPWTQFLDILKAAAGVLARNHLPLARPAAVQARAHAEAGAAPVRPRRTRPCGSRSSGCWPGGRWPIPIPGVRRGAATHGAGRARPGAAHGSPRHRARSSRSDGARSRYAGAASPCGGRPRGRRGRLARLLDALEGGLADSAAAATVRAQIATAAAVQQIVAREPFDFKLAGAARAARGYGSGVTPTRRPSRWRIARGAARVARAAREDGGRDRASRGRAARRQRWYVTRNLLALLEELGAPPAGFSAAPYMRHADARVRWQAVKLQLEASRGARRRGSSRACAIRTRARCVWR